MSCVFCQIIKGEIPSDIIYQDDKIVVFKDINPKAPVHLLVMPKEHVGSIKELKNEHREIVSYLIYTAKKLAEEQNLAGYKLIFNVGREGGQLIDHIHLHLLGGWGGDKERENFPV